MADEIERVIRQSDREDSDVVGADTSRRLLRNVPEDEAARFAARARSLLHDRAKARILGLLKSGQVPDIWILAAVPRRRAFQTDAERLLADREADEAFGKGQERVQAVMPGYPEHLLAQARSEAEREFKRTPPRRQPERGPRSDQERVAENERRLRRDEDLRKRRERLWAGGRTPIDQLSGRT